MKTIFVIFCALLLISVSTSADAQRRPRTGRVCGGPKEPCKGRSNFQPYELPFDTGRNYAIAESEMFYAIILESRKIDLARDCEDIYPERRRIDIQRMFPNNKVFALKCFEPGLNYYTNVANDVGFIGVFAGRTRPDATNFLKQVRNKFPGAALRRMQAGINGT